MGDYVSVLVWLLIAIISVSLVFLVIIGVMVTAIMKKMCLGGQERPYQNEASLMHEAQPQSTTASSTSPAAIDPSSDEDEIVAVITAAVATICGEQSRLVSATPAAGGTGSFSSGNVWRITGRLQNFEGFSDV
jgi:heme exporter protein D